MTTKEKIIRASIKQIQKQIAEIDSVVNSNPLSDIIKLRQEAQTLLGQTDSKGLSNPEFIEQINNMAQTERALFTLAEKQKDSSKLIDEKVELEFELRELKDELYYIEMKN